MSAPDPPPGYYDDPANAKGYQPGPSQMPQTQPQPVQTGYYPAQPQPQPQQYQHHATTTTVVMNQPQSVRCIRFGAYPQEVQCPFCANRVTTNLQYTPGILTWLIVAFLCLLGFWPCFFIPLIMDSVKDVEHFCPVCSNKLGTYQRLS